MKSPNSTKFFTLTSSTSKTRSVFHCWITNFQRRKPACSGDKRCPRFFKNLYAPLRQIGRQRHNVLNVPVPSSVTKLANTCNILKTNEPTSTPIGISGPQGKGHKTNFGGQEVKGQGHTTVTRGQRQIWRSGGGVVLDSRVAFPVLYQSGMFLYIPFLKLTSLSLHETRLKKHFCIRNGPNRNGTYSGAGVPATATLTPWTRHFDSLDPPRATIKHVDYLRLSQRRRRDSNDY